MSVPTPNIVELVASGFYNTFEVYDGLLYAIRGPPDDPAGVIFQSSVDGLNFSNFCTTLPPDDVGLYLRIIFAKGNIVLIGKEGVVYVSTDDTVTWDLALTAVNGTSFYYWSATVDADENIYLATYGDPEPPTVYKSTDGGENWSAIFTDENIKHFHEIATDSYTGHVWLTAGDNVNEQFIYRSTNGGTSFPVLKAGLKITAIEFTEQYVIFGTDILYENKIILYNKETGEWTIPFVFPIAYNWNAIYDMKRASDGAFYLVMRRYDPVRMALWISFDLKNWFLLYEVAGISMDYMTEFNNFVHFRTKYKVELFDPFITVTTNTPIAITHNAATLRGSLVKHRYSVSVRGFDWRKQGAAEWQSWDEENLDGWGIGNFQRRITNLDSNTVYDVKAKVVAVEE